MILLTGATGTVGGALVSHLAGDADVRALVRDAAAASRLRARGIDVVVGSFEDRDALARASAGVEKLFLLSPAGTGDMVAAQAAVIDAAVDAGVRHVVKLSSIGADEPEAPGIIAAHRRIEERIEASPLAWTHLRPNWFMQNELGQADAVAQGTFHAPDVSVVSAVDARDVGEVAARVLTGTGHEGRSYVLTGPEPLGYADEARIYERELGHPVRWVAVELAEAREAMLASGLPETLATGFSEILGRYRLGGVTASVSPDAQRLLGRPPRSFAAFVADHRAAFAERVAA